MICYANDLSADQKAALESILGRPVQDGEAISVRAFEPAKVTNQRRIEIAEDLRQYFDEVDSMRRAVSEEEHEDILSEAMRSVWPGYRSHS